MLLCEMVQMLMLFPLIRIDDFEHIWTRLVTHTQYRKGRELHTSSLTMECSGNSECSRCTSYRTVSYRTRSFDVIKNLIIYLNIAKAIYGINYNCIVSISQMKNREKCITAYRTKWQLPFATLTLSFARCLVCTRDSQHFMKWNFGWKLFASSRREIIATILLFILNECVH